MFNYFHKVQYYETDKMGVTHHSNYIRWMEEARIAWSEENGYSYKLSEDIGIISPVTAIECKYIASSTFSDEIRIEVNLSEYTGVKVEFTYKMYNKDNVLVFEGKSKHCFIKDNKIISIKRENPKLHEIFMKNLG